MCNHIYQYILLEVCIYPIHYSNSRIMGVYWMNLIMIHIISILFQVSVCLLDSYLHDCQTACVVVNMFQVGGYVKIVLCFLYIL